MPPVRVLVDGFNLLHAVVLHGEDRRGWWSAAHQSRVVELVEGFSGERLRRYEAARGPEHALDPAVDIELVVVFDAARPNSPRCPPSPSVDVCFAPDADAWIVEQAAGAAGSRVIVVSRDRALQNRLHRHGVERMRPRHFERLCRE